MMDVLRETHIIVFYIMHFCDVWILNNELNYFLKTILLKYSLHTVKFTHLNL